MTVVQLTKDLKDLPPMPEFSTGEWSQLKKGLFIKRHEKDLDEKGHPIGRGMAYMIIDHPPQKIWAQILDFDRYAEFFPSISKCKIYKQDGGEIYAEFVLKLGMLIKIRYHIHHSFYPSQSRMIWEVDPSRKNDFKQSKGMWTAWPIDDDQSLVGYTISIESGRSVPKFIEDFAASSGLNKVMEALKKRVQKHG